MRIIKLKVQFILLVMAASLASCLDPITVSLPTEFENALVVQGGLVRYKDHAVVNVQFRLASDERSQSNVIRVQNAFVFNDLQQQMELTLDVDGYYKTSIKDSTVFSFSYGRTFYIKVETFDGQQYESVPVALYRTPEIESLNWKIVKKSIVNVLNQPDSGNFVEVYLNTVKQPNPGYYKFDIINSYQYTDQLDGFPPGKTCYVTQRADVRNVMLFDATTFGNAAITQLPVYDHSLDYIYAEGYYATVVQQCIDRDAYDYFLQINELNNREGSIYESPAGRIKTNIRNVVAEGKKAYGYFYAVAQDTARIRILPEEVGKPSRQCPVPPSETSPCPVRACCDCLIINGASLDKPSFWQ